MMQGKEQFRRAITQFRNRYIIAAMLPLLTMRRARRCCLN